MPKRSSNGHKELVIPEDKTVVIQTTSLIPEQGRRLMDAMNGPIDGWAIMTRPGPNNKVLSYIPHGYVADQLNYVFGPFWSFRLIDVKPGHKYDIIEYIIRKKNERLNTFEDKPIKEVIVLGELTIHVYDSMGNLTSTETRTGPGGKVWELPISFADVFQSAESEALKRAAFRLGQKFGLQLYYDNEERRAEWQEKFDKANRPPEPPKNSAQLIARLEGMSDELFMQITGKDWSEITEKDVAGIWEQVEEYKASLEEVSSV